MSSLSDKLNVKTKQVIGKATDNKELEAKGNAHEGLGKLKETLKDAGEKISDKIEETTKKLDK